MATEPTWSEIIRDAVEAYLADLVTSTPAIVESWDPVLDVVSVTPVMRQAYNIGDDQMGRQEIPTIQNVPCARLRTGGFFMSMPIKKGDHVLLVFTHDDISAWRTTGATSDADDLRRHTWAHAVALIGIESMTKPLSQVPTDLAARQAGFVFGDDGGARQFAFTSDGWIQIGGVTPPIVAPLLSPVSLAIGTQQQITALQTQVNALQTEIAVLVANLATINAAVAALVPLTGIADPTGSIVSGNATAAGAVAGAVTAATLVLTSEAAIIEAMAEGPAVSTMLRSV